MKFLFNYILLLLIACHSSPDINALEIEPEETLMQSEIKHVVILMLENRSFDNILGWLYENDAPLQFIPHHSEKTFQGMSDELSAAYSNTLKNSKGEIVFSCSPIKGIPSVASTKFLNSPKYDPLEPFPNVNHQIFGINGSEYPTMLGFLQDYASLWDETVWLEQKQDICAVMESYTANELPILHGLAKHYAVSDLWFSSVPTQTNPNRAFSICGTSEGAVLNASMGKNTFYTDTIFNRLYEEAPDVTWTIFWQTDYLPDVLNGPYHGPGTFVKLNQIPNIDSHFKKLDHFHELARQGKLPDISLIEPQWTMSLNFSCEKFNICSPFFKGEDFILGLQGNDLHPPGDVRTCENFLANIYTSLIANTEAWNQTLLIITFDEHGGLFDHLQPPKAIPPDEWFNEDFKFDRYGVRVPTLFIGPKIDKKVVIRSDQAIPFDHTSLIATLLTWKKIERPKWNLGQRVQNAPTFEQVVTRVEPRQDKVIDQRLLKSYADEHVVEMGVPFYLKNKKGSYLEIESCKEFIALPEPGAMMHGCLAMIKVNDRSLGSDHLLGTSLIHWDCFVKENQHSSNQWWTIKSVDYPFLGSEIHYGDKIYLENHIYLDPFQYVTGRLIQSFDLLGSELHTQAITEEGSEELYWTIEKAN